MLFLIRLYDESGAPHDYTIDGTNKSESQIVAEYEAILAPYPENLRWEITTIEPVEVRVAAPGGAAVH